MKTARPSLHRKLSTGPIFNERPVPAGAQRIGRLPANRRIHVTVVLAPAKPIPAASIHTPEPQDAKGKTRKNPYLTHAELWRRHGATAQARRTISAFAKAFSLKVVETLPHGRSIRLGGRVASFEYAFKTHLDEFELDGRKFFAPATPPTFPVNWSGVVETVVGLQTSPHPGPRRRSLAHSRGTPPCIGALAQAYSFPSGFDGTGETIALIELGGGFRAKDIHDFCSRLGMAAPRITAVEIGNAKNRPASRREVHEFLDAASGARRLSAKAEQSDAFAAAQCTVEVTMDIEIAAALAPGTHLVVYFASLDDLGLFRAISRAVHDAHHRPSVLSISWSMPEHEISKSEMHAIEGVLREAASLGITVCGSSGDNGALNGSADRPSVNYPASSPHCLACGGTSASVKLPTVLEEIVWNATHFGIKGASGGGVSDHFPLPLWQSDARVPAGPERRKGRGVPDVAGLADPRHGCELLIDGRVFTSSGTSAVAPMWAALVARLNQALGRRCGHLHPHIYRLGKERAKALRPVVKGDNGFYQARKGWNACTGYGTPRGDQLLAHLQSWFQG